MLQTIKVTILLIIIVIYWTIKCITLVVSYHHAEHGSNASFLYIKVGNYGNVAVIGRRAIDHRNAIVRDGNVQ